MIESISIKNFLSFKDRETISFLASNKEKGRELPSFNPDCWYKEIGGKKILKFLMCIGQNGAGKTNTLEVFRYLKKLATVKRSSKDRRPLYQPFLLDKESRYKHTEVEIVYYIADKCYSYAVKVSAERIEEEELKIIDGRKTARLYYRHFDEATQTMEVSFGSSCKLSKADQRVLISNTLDNSTLLASFNTVNIDCLELEKNFSFFENKLGVVHKSSQTLADRLKSGDELRDAKIKSLVLALLKDVQSDIVDYNVEETTIDLLKQIDPNEFDADALALLLKKYPEGKIHQKLLRFVHRTLDGDFPLVSDVESFGTMNIVRLMVLIYDVVLSHKAVCEDEIEDGVHSIALAFIIKMFLTLSEDSQMVVATHDSSLFDLDFLRRDSVRILKKCEYGASHITKLDQRALHKNMKLSNYLKNNQDESLFVCMEEPEIYGKYKEILEKE